MEGTPAQLYPAFENFKTRTDLEKYHDLAWALFAMELHLSLDNIEEVAVESITDGKNDRKCDVIYIDLENRKAIIIQSYFAQEIKRCAKKNKATDLNGAIAWTLIANIKNIPDVLLPKVQELRSGLQDGSITSLEVWYIHNCHESDEIKKEIKTVELNTSNNVEHVTKKTVGIVAKEIGIETVERWYKESNAPILVQDNFKISTPGGFEQKVNGWKVFTTAIDARFFHDLFNKYNEKLFSANIRNYLGSRNGKSNINNGIKKTVAEQPENFLVFNNGITALVNDYNLGPRRKSRNGSTVKQSLSISGISIVNGAQTTGAVGQIDFEKGESLIPVRFIDCKDKKIIHDIIQYNNSQNEVQVSDFRSTDEVQKRLREEFAENYSDLNYLGGRRGGAADAIKRLKNLLVSDQVAQSLTAFHGDPMNATHYKSKIWGKDELYSRIFNDETSAGHIIFVYSLYDCLIKYKLNLKEKSKTEDGLKEQEKNLLKFLSYTGSSFLTIYAISRTMETVLDKKIGSYFSLRFDDDVVYENAIEYWNMLVPIYLSLVPTSLGEAVRNKVKNPTQNKKCVDSFAGLITATMLANSEQYKNFSSVVIVD